MTLSQRRWTVAIVIGSVVLTASAIAFGAWFPRQFGKSGSMPHGNVDLGLLPAGVAQNYRFIEAHAELATHIPCYCGCGVAPGHQDLADCYLTPTGYNDHAVYCTVCGRIASDVEAMTGRGLDARTIRTAIDATFAGTGPPTNTPME